MESPSSKKSNPGPGKTSKRVPNRHTVEPTTKITTRFAPR
jgi:hypothetical protein